MNIYRCVRFVSLAVAVFAITNLASGQTANLQRRITQPIDEKSLTVLHGNTHPMAQARFDRGEAPADLPMDRMLLVLKHSEAQETALKNLLMEQQVQDSANFHHWLTPEEFGTQFGPSEADVQAVTAWLGSHGFTVQRVSNGRHVIEFSGSVSQVQSTFHTAIHKYQVNGKDHWANNADPQIPTALASVVAGVKSLHNFRARAGLASLGNVPQGQPHRTDDEIVGGEHAFVYISHWMHGTGLPVRPGAHGFRHDL
jgi:subtilase family serine protease